MAGAADVDVGNGVTLMAPVSGVGRLELSQLGNSSRRNAHQLPFAHAVTGALAEPRPRNDDRDLLGAVGGTEDVAVDLAAVTQNDFQILLADDAGSGLIRALIEGRAETMTHAQHGIVAGRQVDAVDVGQRLTGLQIDGLDLFAHEHFFTSKMSVGIHFHKYTSCIILFIPI